MLKDRKDQIVYRWLFEQEETPVPGDAEPEKQLYAFDFDDTLGVTGDANGVMLYKDGVPAWNTAADAQAWVKQNGLEKDLLKGPKGNSIEQPDGVEGFAIYVNSAGLTKARETADNIMMAPAKPTPENKGLTVVADYSPSSSAKTAEPIDSTLNRIRNAPAGAETQIITARSGESSVAAAKAAGKDRVPKDFAGKPHPPSVESDLAAFMKNQGITLKNKTGNPVKGMGGGDKGEQIKKTYFDARKPEDQPEEVHFFDDDPKNINDVRKALKDVDAEVFLYGPGGFSDKHPHPAGKASADSPKEKYPAKTDKKKKETEPAQQELPLKESRSYGDRLTFDVARWQRMAGIKR